MKAETYNATNRYWGIAYLILLGALAVTGARYTASNYFVQETLGADDAFNLAVTAIRLQPENPSAHEALGNAHLLRNEFGAAADAFDRAVSLSPSNYRLWLELARSRMRSGDTNSAETAYLRAISLAPNYSLPHIELGRLYLQLGAPEKAFKYLATAADLDQSYYSEVLKAANTVYGNDPEAIERAVAPTSTKGKTVVAWYFLDRGWMTETTRAFLLSGDLAIEEKNTVIRFLKEKKNYAFAREVWLSRLVADGETTSSTGGISDGSFELITDNDPSGFGWQIEREIPSVSIALNRKDAHSGTAALYIRFSGNVELQRPIVSQLVPVEPGNSYSLEFYLSAGEIVSAGLPSLLVSDPATSAVLGRSDHFRNSEGSWVRQAITFTASSQPAILISIQRPECTSQPCPIFGEVSIDDISLTPIGR